VFAAAKVSDFHRVNGQSGLKDSDISGMVLRASESLLFDFFGMAVELLGCCWWQMTEDPHQLVNLYATAPAALKAELQKLLVAHWECAGPSCP